MNAFDAPSSAQPVTERFRMEPIRRNLTVTETQLLTPHMLRVTLGGEELAGFRSPSPDDHIKVFFRTPNGDTAGRDYTPRRFDVAARSLTLDFVLHEGGVGSAWAQDARPGDSLQIGGPRGSTVISAPGAWWLLIGDETALPSVARRLEEAAAGTRVLTLMAVTGKEEEQPFDTKADLTSNWLHRPSSEAAAPESFLRTLSELKLPDGPGFVWIAAETEVSRAVRSHVVEVLGHPAEWIKASAYWSAESRNDTT